MKKYAYLLVIVLIITASGCINRQPEINGDSNFTDSINAYSSVYINSGADNDKNRPAAKEESASIIENEPSTIGNLRAYVSNDYLNIAFSLYDEHNNFIGNDGIAKIRIVSRDGTTVYTQDKNIDKSEFQTLTQKMTGQQFLGFYWEIPLLSISKSTDSSGTLFLQFSTTRGTIFSELKESIYGLPEYTEEEIAELNEEEYSKSFISVNKNLSIGHFEVIVTNVGFFTPLVKFGDKEYFRVDVVVKNRGQVSESFSPKGIVLIDEEGNQYEKEHHGTLETFVKLYPGVKKSGYLLFEKIPEDARVIKLMFELGYDEYFNPYTFRFFIPLTNISTTSAESTSLKKEELTIRLQSTNNLDPQFLVDSVLLSFMLKQDEMDVYWQQNNSWGDYEFVLEEGELETYYIENDGTSVESVENTIGGYSAGYEITMATKKYENIDFAKKAFVLEFENTKSNKNGPIQINEIGNERFGVKGSLNLHPYVKIVFRRNNIIVEISSNILTGDVEEITKEIERYAILMDNKVR